MRRSFLTAIAIAVAGTLPASAQTPATTPATVPAAPIATAAPAPQVPATTAPVTQVPQVAQPRPAAATNAAVPPTIPVGVKPPADYVLGIDDALEIVFWQDKDMSASVVVRPDGRISLPLLNDVQAAGLTPEELRAAVTQAATKFVEDPTVTVVVKTINSRKVFVTGQVAKPGPYPLMDSTTVLQMIATAGGVNEYAKSDEITIVRTENGKTVAHRFNYKDVARGKSLAQNITLKPGDTVVVP